VRIFDGEKLLLSDPMNVLVRGNRIDTSVALLLLSAMTSKCRLLPVMDAP
jgi:hypothetical protein